MSRPVQAMSSTSAMDLVAAARAGDRNAYGVLYERYRNFAYRIAHQLRASDTDDIVSEAFRKTIAAIEGGSGPTHAFGPYLATAVRSVVKDQRKRLVEAPLTEEPHTEPSQIEHDFDPRLARAFWTLPPHFRAAIWYVDVEGRPPREVARIERLPTANAMSARLNRARAALRLAYLCEQPSSPTSDDVDASAKPRPARRDSGPIVWPAQDSVRA